MKMKCGCANNSSGIKRHLMNYERYSKLPTLAELGVEIEDKYDDNENEEELIFYNENDTYQTVVVVHKLRASDLCQILAMKNRVHKDCHWSIVEQWIDIGLERSVEDHEDILQVYKHMESYPKPIGKRFIFRKDYGKYEVFANPQKFFPSEMVDLSGFPGAAAEDITNPEALQSMVEKGDGCPPMFGQVWVRDPHSLFWAKAYLLLKERKLYLSYKVQIIANFLRHWNSSGIEPMMMCDSDAQLRIRDEHSEFNQLTLFARIADSSVYRTLNAKKELHAPTDFGICIRTTENELDDSSYIGDVTSDLKCIACETERSRACWISAMRLSKYGKQLRDNYRTFRSRRQHLNEYTHTMLPSDYTRHSVSSESLRSRVAMDFTGNVGRLIEDPVEAQAVAEFEAKQLMHHKLRPSLNLIPNGIDTSGGVHIAQPWFHSKLSRDQATMLINKYGSMDGVFLVRESHTNPGIYVLTFKCSGKVIHTQIQPIMDSVRETLCYTLDSGVTKFYDMLQLIEFYQLNAGCLPTRLTHYLALKSSTRNNSGSTQQQQQQQHHHHQQQQQYSLPASL